MSIRHRWFKLEEHRYICRKCGCGKVNECPAGKWVTTFYRPFPGSAPWRDFDGTPTPGCEVGPLTEKWLAERLAPALDAARHAKEGMGG